MGEILAVIKPGKAWNSSSSPRKNGIEQTKEGTTLQAKAIHRWASSFSPWEGVHFFFSQRGVDFFKTGGGQGGGPWKKNFLEFLKSAIRAEKLLQK